jgi:ribosomal protein S18 acetylase RimI-like enzyme
MAAPTIHPVTADEVRPVAAAISRGFADNEIWEWMIPDDERRARLLPRYYEFIMRSAYIPRGEAWTTDDLTGGALWNGPTKHGLRPLEQMREALIMLGGGFGAIRRGARYDAAVTRHHPKEPHLYLLTLSIDPSVQRSGQGSALMAPLVERCDSERVPAFLETQRESNIPFYRRFGFELTERVQIPDGPPVWLMWRAVR